MPSLHGISESSCKFPFSSLQACVKKDERALRTFVQRYIQLPLPDYGGRLALLGAFAQVWGVDVAPGVPLLPLVIAQGCGMRLLPAVCSA